MKKSKKDFFKFISEQRVTTVAAAWVYYFLTALLPLAFLLITAFGVFKVDLTAELIRKLPEEFRQAGEVIVNTAKNASGGITVFFIITVFFSGSALLNQMIKDGEHFYGLIAKRRGGILRRLLSIGALGVLFCAFLAAALLITFGSKVSELIGLASKNNLFAEILSFSFVILFIYGIIILLNALISPVKLKFSNLLTGAFVALAITVIGSLAFMLYLRFFANYNKFYGSLAAIIVFLLWAYIVMLGISVGAATSTYLYKKENPSKEKENA